MWFLYLFLKVFPVDPKYCLVVLSVVIVALYIMLEIKHWLFKGQGSLRQLQSLSFVLFLSFVLSLFKILLLCAIILLLKLLVQLYDILIVLRLNILLYGWFSSKDVVIKFKNYFSILEFIFKLNYWKIKYLFFFVLYFFSSEQSCRILCYHYNWLNLVLFRICFFNVKRFLVVW